MDILLLFYLSEEYFPVDGQSLWNTEDMFRSWWEDPMRNHLWITLMLSSTLIPTLMHFVIVIISFLERVFFGTPIDTLFQHIEEEDYLQAAKDLVAYRNMYLITFLIILLVISIPILYYFFPEMTPKLIDLMVKLLT